MLVLLEGLVMSFWLLLICVVGIANDPVDMVVFYEQDVKDRVVALGLTTKEKIKKTTLATSIALFIPVLLVVPWFVYGVNHVTGTMEAIKQMIEIYLIMGLFDRVFIDWYWVGHTKAWIIPGTEDLRPYIPAKALARKWLGTIVGFPMLACIIGWIVHMIH